VSDDPTTRWAPEVPAGAAPAGGEPPAERGWLRRVDDRMRSTRPLHQTSEIPLLAGVALRLGQRVGVDPLLVRLGFFLATVAGGFGIPLYLVAWVVVGSDRTRRRPRTGRSAFEVGLGAGLLVLSGLLVLRATGLWISDVLTWPVVLLAAGGALIWRSSVSRAPDEPAADAPVKPRAQPQTPEAAAAQVRRRANWAATNVSRTGVGIALVFAAAFVFIRGTNLIGGALDALITVLVVTAALGVVFAPWIIRLVRSLDDERAERIRVQERAEVAAHLHDSVLQTLALVQKRADDPAQVAALARAQERELRAWLSGRKGAGDEPRKLSTALEQVASEVEQAHGATVDVVAVGDVALDDRGEALVAATREAVLNGVRHGGGAVSVYAEASGANATVFVRDRGPGFDPTDVPADRRGISESILGRMERHGGRAQIHAAPGQGTEVELSL
jgi:signal transduction histidine kinase/phage shock protein PspC (stress-responsive transcriptional regulator)